MFPPRSITATYRGIVPGSAPIQYLVEINGSSHTLSSRDIYKPGGIPSPPNAGTVIELVVDGWWAYHNLKGPS